MLIRSLLGWVDGIPRSFVGQRRGRDSSSVDDYAAFGVRDYWIVDRQLRSLEILELGPDGRYAQALGASAGVLEKVPGRDGLTVDLDALWAAVDRLQAAADDDAAS